MLYTIFMTTKQTFWASIFHMIAQGLVWFGPMLILSIPPSIGSLTISGLLSMGIAWIAHRGVIAVAGTN
jgi:hypothetical protein